jgi:hypothetical protein
LFEIIKGAKNQKVAYIVLGLLACGTVGGKASNSILFGFALVVMMLGSIVQKHELRNRILISGIASLTVIGLTFRLLISSSESRDIGAGIFLGFPGLLLTVIPTALGIYGLFRFRQSNFDPLLCFTLSIFLIGALCSAFTHQAAGAQIYFLVSAATVCIVPSMIGFEKLLHNESDYITLKLRKVEWKRTHSVMVFSVLAAGLLTFVIWISYENVDTNIGKVLRTLSPLPLYILCALGLHLTIKRFLPKIKAREKTTLFLVMVLSASLISSSAGIVYSIFGGPLYSKSGTLSAFGKSEKVKIDSISYDYVLAGKWVKENLPNGEILFTNRQCIVLEIINSECDGLWFYASSLTNRQFLIEGNGYAIKNGNSELTRSENQKLSIRFSLEPNDTDWKHLWEKNVRWGWIDRRVSKRTEWGKFAREVYSNRDISIIRLLEVTG